jgi:DNA-binding transcriptional MerR regulator
MSSSEGIVFLHVEYFSDSMKHVREKLNRRDKKIKAAELSYRILNYWEKNNLFAVERGDAGTGWRRFSIVDIVWIYLIIELRKFGVSIENIRIIKEQLTQSKSHYFPSVYPSLEFHTALFLSSRKPVYVMIFDNFQVLIGRENEIDMSLILGGIGNHLRIGLHDIIQNIFKHRNLSPKSGMNVELSDKEAELLLELRTGAYKAITVKLKNGEMVRLEKEPEINEKDLHKIMREANYDTITLVRENGKVVNITQVIKKNL